MRSGCVPFTVRHAERDVVAERVGKQERLLRHEADGAAQLGQRDVAHISSVDEHRAARRVVQPRQQVHERRLAGPRAADDRHRLARLHREGDVAQHLAVAVRES